jgi:hypothetical protein
MIGSMRKINCMSLGPRPSPCRRRRHLADEAAFIGILNDGHVGALNAAVIGIFSAGQHR